MSAFQSGIVLRDLSVVAEFTWITLFVGKNKRQWEGRGRLYRWSVEKGSECLGDAYGRAIGMWMPLLSSRFGPRDLTGMLAALMPPCRHFSFDPCFFLAHFLVELGCGEGVDIDRTHEFNTSREQDDRNVGKLKVLQHIARYGLGLHLNAILIPHNDSTNRMSRITSSDH